MLSKEDQEARRFRVTASTVAAFLGFHWYSSPLQQWEYHMGVREFPTSINTRLGTLIEPGLAQFAVEELEWKEWRYPCGSRISKTLPWAAATPDVLTAAENMGIQLKNQNGHMRQGYLGKPGEFGEHDNAIVPPYMLAQCQWEMLVTGARRWYLGTYFGGNDFRLYHIWRDEEMLERLVKKAYPFWQKYLDPNGPQDPPVNEPWNPKIGKKKGRMPSREELLAAPIPRPT